MLSRIRVRLSYANVMATLAVFMVVAGGSFAIASVKKNQVESKHVENNSLKSNDLKNEKAVKSADIKDGEVGSSDIGDGAVGSGEIADGSVGAADVGAGAIGTSELGTIVVRQVAFSIEDDASPHERQEVDCNQGEQAISADVSPGILGDDDELLITELNYDPDGATAVPDDTGWIFGLGNLDDVTGVGDGDNTAITGFLQVLCLVP